MRRGLVLPFALVLSLALAAGLTELYDGLEAALGQVRLEGCTLKQDYSNPGDRAQQSICLAHDTQLILYLTLCT